MGKLSGSHGADAAGLPRGRNSMSLGEVREAQRRRLVRAAISAFAERGYAATTIADIVSRARVARQVFYELFETKEDCFLAAEALGREALLTGVSASMNRQKNQQIGSDTWIRAPVRTYLRICAEEPQFARAWTVEFPNAGARTLARRNAFFVELAALLREGHKAMLAGASPTVPKAFYEAAIGGAFELIFRCVSQDRYEELPGLENTLVEFILTVLGHRSGTA